MRLALTLAAIIIGLDQLSKFAILEWVMSPPRVIEILPVLNIVLAFNRGVSFSMLTSDAVYSQYLLSLLALAVCGGLLMWVRSATDTYTRIAAGFIIGGAIGNVIDRLRVGAVVDFIDLHWGAMHWPAFNVADSAIFVGAAILIVDALFSRSQSR
jgi:signal peptidase II